MIKKTEQEDEIYSFIKDDIYSLRIKSLLKAYGMSYDFVSFYCCYDMNSNIIAIISRLDNDFTVSCLKLNKETEEEISAFIETVGYESVLTDDSINLFNGKFEYGEVMESVKKSEFSLPDGAEIDEYPKLMDIFDLENYDNWNFDAWYVDLNHRIRHNCAKAYALCVDEEIASSAVFSSIYNHNAILSSVLTKAEFRGNGYATALVSHMICDVKGTVYLMRENNKNESFYKKLGFVNTGIWRMYKE